MSRTPDASETGRGEQEDLVVRPPRVGDGSALWRLVGELPGLEENTLYAYLLLCRDFAATCRVAEDRAGLAGLVCGYRPPAEPEVFFVWQVGVHERARRRGLAVRLIRDVLDSGAAPRFRFLEATVADDNEPSRRLFTGLARNLGAACRVTDGFTADQFSPLSHPAEPRYRIGPIGSTS